MFCKNCGAELKDGSKFCTKCGATLTPIPQEAPAMPVATYSNENTPPKKSKAGLILLIILLILIVLGGAGAGLFFFLNQNKEEDTGSRRRARDEKVTEQTDAPAATDATTEETGEATVVESEQTSEATVVEEVVEEDLIQFVPGDEALNTDTPHTYQVELVDCTWTEALEIAASYPGGYLAHINSEDEYKAITQFIDEAGLDASAFWIGAARPNTGRDFYWVDAQGNMIGEPINDSPYWLEGEPSIVDSDFHVNEYYVELFNVKRAGGWVMNDTVDDILELIPANSGKIGIIIEIEEDYTDPAILQQAGGELATESTASAASSFSLTSADLDDAYAAYLEYLNKSDCDTWCSTAELAYINDDDIPEVIISSDIEAYGNLVLTYGNGKVDEWYSNRLSLGYIERGNRILNSDGHMDYYHDYVVEIKNGKFSSVFNGNWNAKLDSNGEYAYVNYPMEKWDTDEFYAECYEWYIDDKPVSYSTYQSKLEKACDLDKLSYGNDELSYGELLEILSE